MGATVFKQPNGLYGRYSYVSDGFTNVNMSKEEYIISKLEHAITEAKDSILNKNLGNYKRIIADAEKHVKDWDEYISEAEDEEEKNDLIKEKKEMEEEFNSFKEAMNNPPDEDQEKYNSFYKELLTLIENLCIDYNIEDWNYIRKDYVPSDYPNEDLVKFTKKIKEINSLYNELKEKRING